MQEYLIFETDHFTVSQTDGYRVPGYLIVHVKGDKTELADFTAQEAADLGRCLADTEKIVAQVLQPPRVYVLKFAEVNQRVHFHVFPRTEAIAQAYEAATQEVFPYNGAKLVAWVWENHEALGFSDAQIEAFVHRAREAAALSGA